MARVLLLNPPSPTRPLLRDFGCGESTKADYYWAPIDLLVLSGLLSDKHEIDILDATVEGLGSAAALRRAQTSRPDVIFSQCAAVSLDSDDQFLVDLKGSTGAAVYGLGDVASFEPEKTLGRTRAFDGLVQNFADPTLTALADGTTEGVTSVVLKSADGAIDHRRVSLQKPLSYGRPLHARFPLHRYRLPFSRWTRSTTVLTAYGCPFPCSFCASNGLPWQVREIDDVIDELKYIRSLGLDQFYLRDFTFGPTTKRGLAICEAMIAAKLGLRWSAECRIEVLDEELVTAMGRAGCEVILVGIETGDSEVARQLGKRYRPDHTRRILQKARDLGIRSCGHFVLGSPDETLGQLEDTARYARSLPLDYASFNMYAPRLGTGMRDDLVAAGRVEAADFENQDVSLQANPYADVTSIELKRLFQRAVLGFYFRPTQLARLAKNTPWSTLARQGSAVVKLLLEAR